MYYAIFKRFAKNKYGYLGVSKKKLDASGYDLFSEKNDDSKYLYFELDENELEKPQFEVNTLYIDKGNGLEKYIKKEPETLYYSDLIDFYDKIEKFRKKYNFNDQIISPFHTLKYYETREVMKENTFSNRENRTKAIWYTAGKGVGKTYLLNAIKESFERPSIIIDCSTLAENEDRFIYQEIFERILREFDEDVDSINNAIIMLDNVDKVKLKNRSLQNFFWLIQRQFISGTYQKYYSKEFGEGEIAINNAIVIFTSTLGGSIYDDLSDRNFFRKELVDYMEIKFDRKTCENYLNSELSCLKILEKYYKTFGTKLVFTTFFIEELINKVLSLGEGYNGFRILMNNLINDNMKKYREVVFNSFDNIEYKDKKNEVLSDIAFYNYDYIEYRDNKYKVLRNVR